MTTILGPLAFTFEADADAFRSWVHSEYGLVADPRFASDSDLQEMYSDYLHAHPQRDPNYDPMPWCSGCGARTSAQCHCGPIAEND